MENPPRITIIVACLNAGRVLERCLYSIENQDYDNFEIIVSDGGSNDRSVGILQDFQTRMGAKIKWKSETDKGIADAWNKAILKATGDWILFLGADDSLASKDILSKIAPILSETTHRIVYGHVRLIDVNGFTVGELAQPWSAAEFRGCRRNLPHQAVFHHKSLFAGHNIFDTSLTICSDYDFLLRELINSEPLHLPNCIISNMQLGGLSNNRRNAPQAVFEQIILFRRHVHGIPIILSWWLIKAIGIKVLYHLMGDVVTLRITNIYRRWVGGREPLSY